MPSTPDPEVDQTALIQILTWFLFLVGVFSLCARFGSKLFLSVRVTWDDWLALAAQCILLFQCIALSYGAANGLGRSTEVLSDDELNRSLHAEYAYIPLFLLASALIKASLSVFIAQLTPNYTYRRLNKITAVAAVAWFLTSLIVSLFQCAMPTPWDVVDQEHCINRGAWWSYVAGLNIATELGYVMIYFLVFRSLQTSLLRKISVMGIFSARLLVAITIAIQLVLYLNSLPAHGSTAYNPWAPIVCNQVVLCLSVVTACVPYLKPFMQSIELGVVQVNDEGSQEELSQRQTTAAAGNSNSERSKQSARKGSGQNSRGGLRSQLSQVASPAVMYGTSHGRDSP